MQVGNGPTEPCSDNAPAVLEGTLRASLYRITLESPDPEALAQYYTRALGFQFDMNKDLAVGSGRDRRLTLCRGTSGRLSEACYVVPDAGQIEKLVTRLRAVGIEVSRNAEESFADSVVFTDPDGNKMVFATGAIAEGTGASADSLRMRPARLQHLVLASANATRLVDFYCNAVGFKRSDTVLDDKGIMRTAFLNCGHEHHSLAVFATNENRLDHFCFEAGDWGLIRDWADHFASERIAVKWGPGRHGPGNNLFVFIHDLDGNWVEVSAELEHVAPDRPMGTWRHEQRTLNTWGVGLLRS
jgi:catechol 2,3-dioxygenase